MADDFRSKIFEMMEHMEKNGSSMTHMVDGEEVEAQTAEEQMAIFMMQKEKEKEAAMAEELARQREEDLAAIAAMQEELGEPEEDDHSPSAIIRRAALTGKKDADATALLDGQEHAPKAEPEKEENKAQPEKKANLWGGRFEKATEKKVYDFNASILFDQRLYFQDILGSMAHVSMLAKVGVLTQEESEQLIHALSDIQKEVEEGALVITDAYEDIHSFVEAQLIERLGDVGKKVHTGRSRNDQVALDMRMYIRSEVLNVDRLLAQMLQELYTQMEANIDTIMPGFTHLQKAQPTTLAHHLGAYFEMFKRDRSRLEDLFHRMNYCPLGSGAFAGTTYPLDREYTAQLLGFFGPTLNSMDGVSDRDYLIDFLSALAEIQMHLSRFSEEVIIWNSNEYQFVEIDDAYSTGSSIMPQKKNPDIAELVRGKTGRVYGALMSMLTTMKGIPLAYNKDMQEDKEVAFDAIDNVKICLELFADMIATMKFNNGRMEESAKHGFTNATDAADYLVNHGVPFRDAHGIVGQLVIYGIREGKAIDEMSLDELKAISDVFEEDIYEAISLETCVNKRLTIGAPGHEAMEAVLMSYKAYLASDWQTEIGVPN